MKTIAAFIVGLLIATVAWAQIDKANGIVWLPNCVGTLNGKSIKWACASKATWCGAGTTEKVYPLALASQSFTSSCDLRLR